MGVHGNIFPISPLQKTVPFLFRNVESASGRDSFIPDWRTTQEVHLFWISAGMGSSIRCWAVSAVSAVVPCAIANRTYWYHGIQSIPMNYKLYCLNLYFRCKQKSNLKNMYLHFEQQQATKNTNIAVVSSNCSTLKLYSVIYCSTYSNCNSLSSSHSVMWKVICTKSIPAWPLFYFTVSKAMV